MTGVQTCALPIFIVAVGVGGCVLIVALDDATDVQVPLLTVNV